MSAPLRLRIGDAVTAQQSSVTCGAAVATVARMLVDAPFARWVRDGEGSPVIGAEGGTAAERFASYERTVHRRTNGMRRPGGGLDPPWPRALGTPPWGLRHELERYGSLPGTRYEYDLVRHRRPGQLERAYARLAEAVVDGEPAALYVGNDRLPRHVTLVVPGPRGGTLCTYEPSVGRVVPLECEAFARGALTLGGWARPWLLVRPTGHRRILLDALQRVPLPRLVPEPMADLLHRDGG